MGQPIFFTYPLALAPEIVYHSPITRAVPLGRKVNAHNGRVFYFSETRYRDGFDYRLVKIPSFELTMTLEESRAAGMHAEQVGTKSAPSRHQVGTKSWIFITDEMGRSVTPSHLLTVGAIGVHRLQTMPRSPSQTGNVRRSTHCLPRSCEKPLTENYKK